MNLIVVIVGVLTITLFLVGFIGSIIGMVADNDSLVDFSYPLLLISLGLAMIMSVITGG